MAGPSAPKPTSRPFSSKVKPALRYCLGCIPPSSSHSSGLLNCGRCATGAGVKGCPPGGGGGGVWGAVIISLYELDTQQPKTANFGPSPTESRNQRGRLAGSSYATPLSIVIE